MTRAKWIILGAVVLGLAFALLPGHLRLSPIVSDHLAMLEPDANDAHSIRQDGMVLQNFGKTRGAPSIASIFIYANPVGAGAYNLRTHLQHDETFRIESMRLTFRIPFDQGSLALVTPEGGPWNSPNFARNPADGSISFSVDHLGFMGTGSVVNEFTFEPFSHEPGDISTFTLHATFTLRSKSPLQLKQDVVDADIEVSLPVRSSETTSAP
jgi:hypothetical protein